MDKKAEYWTGQIDKLLANRNYKWAKQNLEGIKTTIENTGTATDGQIQAIKNIKWGRNDN